MNDILEDVKTDEELKEMHNSRTGDFYRQILAGKAAPVQSNNTVSSVKTSSISEARPVTESTLTFADLEIPESVKRVESSVPPVYSAPVAPQTANTQAKAYDYSSSIYADPSYMQAAMKKAGMSATNEETAEEDLSKPSPTTLQYATQAVANAKSVSVSDVQKYYADLIVKVAVVFVVAFAIALTVIAINSSLINGMDIQLFALQQNLNALQSQYTLIQQSIASEISWDAIREFIENNGMIPLS